MKKRTLYINIGVIVFVTLLLLIYIFFVDGIDNLVSALSQAKLSWLLGAVLMIVIYWAMESLSVYVFAKRLYPQHRVVNSIKTVMIGQLFNCITPFATGGQPMQVFMLVQRGMPAGLATLCLFARFFVYQAVLTLMSITALLLKLPYFIANVSTLGYVVLIGFIINFAVFAGLISVSVFPNGSKTLVKKIISLLSKIKIVKDKEASTEKALTQIELFYSNIREIKKYTFALIEMIILTFFQLIAYFAIPFFIIRALGVEALDFFDAICSSSFVLMVSSFVPLPGAALGAEGSFMLFFKMYFIGDNFLGVAMLIWRFITFYIPIIVGMFFMNRLHKIENITLTSELNIK